MEFFILDLRPLDEYVRGHIPGAVSVPLFELPRFYPTERMFTDIIIYAGDRATARKGARILSDTAYFRVRTLGAWPQWTGEKETGAGRTWKDLVPEVTQRKSRKRTQERK